MEESGMNTGGMISYDVLNEILIQAAETRDDFIFSTIQPFIENKLQIIVNKNLLERALVEYFKNHPEEYNVVN